jgi:ADP-ribose pyrophosphatase YjhB (NUDIX family)
MPEFLPPDSHIHILARGLVLQGDNVILCQVKGKKWFFLPGGHVEDGESALTALAREMKEELGLDHYSQPEFLGLCEHTFEDKPGMWQHEISLVFSITVDNSFSVASQEGHIDFVSVKKDDLASLDLRPGPLKAGLLDWVTSGKVFFKNLPAKE